MVRYQCDTCSEILRSDDIVYMHRNPDLMFCSRECEDDYEVESKGEEYVLCSDDFEE